MKALQKVHDKLRADFRAANFALLLLSDQTSLCFDEKEKMRQKFLRCMKEKHGVVERTPDAVNE